MSLRLLPLNDLADASRISDVIFSLEDDTAVAVNDAIDGGVTIRSAEHVLLYTSDKLSVENGEVRIANEGRFLPGETVTVDVPEGMFVDAYGNGNEHKSFAFSVTSETVQPAVEALASAFLFESGVVEVQFDSMVTLGAGAVKFDRVRCCSESVMSAELAAEASSLFGAYEGLEVGEEYAITLAENTVFNIYGNGNAEVTLETRLRVQSAEKPQLVVEACQPTEGSVSVALNGTAQLVFDQEVAMAETCVVVATSAESQTVELVAVTEGYAVSHVFELSGLLPFTLYNLTVPAGCFHNGYLIDADAVSFSFLTTRGVAPAPLSFNLEGQVDVAFDAVMQFTFDQDVVVPEGATVLIKAREGEVVARSVDAVEGNVVTLYSRALSQRLASKTEYTVFIPEGVVCNSDGLCMEATTFAAFTTVQDSTARVILQHTVPTAGAVQVEASQAVVLHFTNTIRACAGAGSQYVIYENNEAVEGSAVFEGREVRMSFPLKSGFTYTYVYDMTLFCTPKGAPVQYDIGSSFSFTVADTEGPEHYTFAVSNMQSVEVRFNENVVGGAGALRVFNSQEEQVVGPLSVTLETPSSQVVLYMNAQSLPDDVYTFRFSAGFVKDLMNNDSPAFEESFAFDRVAPFVEAVVQPTTPFAAVELHFNEAVELRECVMEVEEQGRRSAYDMTRVAQTSSTVVSVLPMNDAWQDSARLELVIPASCFVDLRGVMMAATKVVSIETPAIVPLRVLGEESVPAAGAVKAVAEVVEGVAITFDAAVEYVPQKLVQLRSGEGCVVSDAEHMTVANGTVVFAVASQACLSGRVYLVAEAGAFYSVETGASSPASSAADALYAFNMLPAGPVLVSASAVYSVGLQIAKNARIDLSFDRAIQWNGESLALIEFVDQYGASVPFAAQYHAEVEGAVLRLVVDEAFSTPSSSQIRVVRVLPVLPGEGIVALSDPQDSCVGEAMMVRVFSLPPLTSRIEVVGAMPVTSNPSLRVVFDQEVKSGAAECAAIIIHDDRSTLSVPVARLTRESATVYSWTASALDAFLPNTEYRMMVDQSCFVLADSDAPASGVSGPFVMVTGANVMDLEVVALSKCDGAAVSGVVALDAELRFCVVFNKAVRVRAEGFVYLMNREDGSLTQIPGSKMRAEVDSKEIEVSCRDSQLAASAVYTVRVDAIAEDAAGETMQNTEATFAVSTPAMGPYEVTNVSVQRVQTGAVLVEFDAAVDSSLKTAVSASDFCHYSIVAAPGFRVSAWDDVCVSIHSAPVRIARLLTDIDAHADTTLTIACTSAAGLSMGAARVEVASDAEAVPKTPSAVKLLSVVATPDAMRYRFGVNPPYSFASPVLGYTFLFLRNAEVTTVSVEYSPAGVYDVEVEAATGALEVAVKAVTAAGASAFSELVSIAEPDVATAAPPKVASETVKVTQTSASEVRLEWAAPASRESIVSYLVRVGDAEAMAVTEPWVELHDLEEGEVRVTITVRNDLLESEPTVVEFAFTPRITASLRSVSTGASDATAVFSVSYAEAAVECALNVGHLIRAHALANEKNEAVLFFPQLIPGSQYSGSCWAYSVASSVVSEAIPIRFTTKTSKPAAQLAVEDFVFESRARMTVRVAVDVPAMVTCVVDAPAKELSYNELRLRGVTQLVFADAPSVIEVKSARLGAATSAAAFCAAFDTTAQPLSPIVRSEVSEVRGDLFVLPVPAVSVEGRSDVSIRPRVEVVFDREVVCRNAVFVIQKLGASEKQVFGCEAFEVTENAMTLTVVEPLERGTQYTWFFDGESVISDVEGEVFLAAMAPGEHVFTTVSEETVPVVTNEGLDLGKHAVGEAVAITFSEAVTVNPAVAITVSHEGWSRVVEASVEEASLVFATTSLHANTVYAVEVPACAVIDLAGNCVATTTLRLETLGDELRPFVVSAEPEEGRSVPNDVPLVLTFSEEVVLANVRDIVIRLNYQEVSLNALDVHVAANKVMIDLEGGYSQGNGALERVEVSVEVKEGAFKDLAENNNEYYMVQFTASPLRCGSSYLASSMTNACECYSREGKCFCDCGGVNLFEL